MEEVMTDKQFDKILKMVSMILDGCNDLDEAKAKIKELSEDQKKEKPNEQKGDGVTRRGGGLAKAAPTVKIIIHYKEKKEKPTCKKNLQVGFYHVKIVLNIAHWCKEIVS